MSTAAVLLTSRGGRTRGAGAEPFALAAPALPLPLPLPLSLSFPFPLPMPVTIASSPSLLLLSSPPPPACSFFACRSRSRARRAFNSSSSLGERGAWSCIKGGAGCAFSGGGRGFAAACSIPRLPPLTLSLPSLSLTCAAAPCAPPPRLSSAPRSPAAGPSSPAVCGCVG